MGFGSGGGGFTPSPNNVPGSTTTGTDKDTDTHQFTGSVDITGSLTLNGSSITGGGGGGTPGGSNSQVQYNDGGAFGGASALVYDDVNNRVGIGTGTPESTLEIRSTTTQQKWSYDDDNEFTVTVGSDGETVLAVSGTVGASPASDLVFDVSRGGDVFIRRQGDRLRFGVSTGTTTIQTDNAGTDIAFVCHPAGGLGVISTEIARFDNSGAGALLMSGTISSPGGDAPINFRNTATSIHSPGANRLALTAPTLEVTGTLGLNGTSLTSTAAELNLLDAGATQHTASVLAAIPKLAKATYDFDEFTGVAATYTLTGVTLPDNAMIVGGWVDTETNAADASGTPTIAFGMTAGAQTDMFLGATAFSEFNTATGGVLTPVNQTTPTNYFKLSAATTITCTIAGGNLSAGKLHIYLQYVVGA